MSTNKVPVALFKMGRIVTTPNAMESLPPEDVVAGIQRHQSGDWGEMQSEDRAANDRALSEGTRLFSRYETASGIKFWIITEADRSTTMLLLPEDY